MKTSISLKVIIQPAKQEGSICYLQSNSDKANMLIVIAVMLLISNILIPDVKHFFKWIR